MAIFTGAGVAIITPFHEDGSINYDQLKKLVDYHCENGTDSIVICGTTGESATMTEEEHLECIKRTIDFTAGRIPVIAGTGSNCTATAVELSREAAKAGADGLLVVTPYYNKATQKGLIEHYKAIAREADILISCAGVLNSLTKEYVRPGQVVIDVSINWDPEKINKKGGKGAIAGDAVFDEVEPIVEAITPVPGGVGSVTTSVLVGHVVEAAMRKFA